ncbi:hypothetical protein B296_00037742, partial [Ensete ventricosum]
SSITATWSVSRSRGSTPTALELDTLSSDLANSLRAQLRQVNQRLDEIHKEFVKSTEELRENSKGGSPFAPEIQYRPIPTNFCLPSLESYDDSSDPTEHILSFWVQMVLYNTSDASGRSKDDTVGNLLEVRQELTEGIESLLGWHKRVRRKKTETCRKIVRGSRKAYRELGSLVVMYGCSP